MILDPIKCFRLTKLSLKSSSFEALDDVSERSIDQEHATVQTRRWVEARFVLRGESEDTKKFLQVIVNIGTRLISPDGPDESTPDSEEAQVLYTVEASFLVEFAVVSEDFTEEQVKEFAERNGAHVAWPFWRQHVASILQAANLPVLQVPLMAKVIKPNADPAAAGEMTQ